VATEWVDVAGIVGILERSEIACMLIIDACYEGEIASCASQVLTGTAIGNLRDVADVLRFFNQFRGPNPVVFSAEPGTIVETVAPPPSVGLDQVTIGPLARRLALALEETGQNDLVLQRLVDRLSDRDLDKQTLPAVSHFEVGDFRRIVHRPSEVEVNTRIGTSSPAIATPLASAAPALEVQSASRDVLSAMLQLNGPNGEWILDGQMREFVLGQDDLEILTFEAGEVSLVFSGGGEDWDVNFAAPVGAFFERGMSITARRFFLQEENEGGLEISGDGRACNEIEGNIEVNDATFDSDGLVALELSFEQRCDGQSTLLKGNLQIALDAR